MKASLKASPNLGLPPSHWRRAGSNSAATKFITSATAASCHELHSCKRPMASPRMLRRRVVATSVHPGAARMVVRARMPPARGRGANSEGSQDRAPRTRRSSASAWICAQLPRGGSKCMRYPNAVRLERPNAWPRSNSASRSTRSRNFASAASHSEAAAPGPIRTQWYLTAA